MLPGAIGWYLPKEEWQTQEDHSFSTLKYLRYWRDTPYSIPIPPSQINTHHKKKCVFDAWNG
jgi:hypothetical protein